jgi:Spy/CpxP family protein refolding chaperone
MQSEDQYLDRTPDLVAKVRAMREAAQKEMNRFTRIADYDVRRVVGHGTKSAQDSAEAFAASERPRKSGAKSASAQSLLEFSPAPVEHGDDGESA